MVFTGSTLARASGLVVIRHKDEFSSADLALLITQEPVQGSPQFQFRLKAIHPPYRSEPMHAPEGFHKKTDHFYLPDVDNIGPDIKELCLGTNGELRLRRPFNQPVESYRKQISRMLSNLDSTRRITLQKLEGFLYRQIVSKTNNPTLASIICARDAARSETGLFYTALDPKFLADVFLFVVVDFVGRGSDERG